MKGITKTILIIGGVILGIIIVVSIVSVFVNKSVTTDLGETVTIEEENIEITVLSSEKTTLEDSTGMALESGDFIKVQVRIKNNGSSPYTWNNLSSFNVGDKYVAMSEPGDELPNTIEVGKVEEGYLYFEYTDVSIMEYYTSPYAVDSNTAEVAKYYFNIK